MTRQTVEPGLPALASTPADARKKAYALVRELVSLAPVLAAEHKKYLIQQLVDAFATQGEVLSSSALSLAAKPSAAPAPLSATAKSVRPLVACPHCKSMIRADRLDRHIAKIHTQKSSRVPVTLPRPAGIYALPKGVEPSRVPRERIVCGDCERTIFRDEYATHDCRPGRRRGPVVLGGAPGLGRRR
jgi:hypothetical protein